MQPAWFSPIRGALSKGFIAQHVCDRHLWCTHSACTYIHNTNQSSLFPNQEHSVPFLYLILQLCDQLGLKHSQGRKKNTLNHYDVFKIHYCLETATLQVHSGSSSLKFCRPLCLTTRSDLWYFLPKQFICLRTTNQFQSPSIIPVLH